MNNIKVIDDGENLFGKKKDLIIYLMDDLKKQSLQEETYEDVLTNYKNVWEIVVNDDDFSSADDSELFIINYDNSFGELFVSRLVKKDVINEIKSIVDDLSIEDGLALRMIKEKCDI